MRNSNPNHQGTIEQTLVHEGPGLHSGGLHCVAIKPADADHGIIFRKIDRRGRVTRIPATWRHVRPAPLCTCLAAKGGAKIRTVEHLLAAFYACGIDNATVDVHGQEVPILDGSAGPWVGLIQEAGIRRQGVQRRRIVVRRKIEVTDAKRHIIIKPSKTLRVCVRTSTKGFGKMVWKGPLNRDVFVKEIATARTFGRLSQGLAARLLTAATPSPLCQGASTKSAIVISRGRVLNRGGLRYPDEFVRHRVLDLMGDLMLSGADIIGHITVRSPVHRLNHKLMEAIFTDPEAWEPA